MYPLNLDDSLDDLREEDILPDAPITSPQNRRRVAFNWYHRKGVPMEEIAERLGVQESTVDTYVNELSDEELNAMVSTRAEVRAIAAQELQDQLREVGKKRRTAETQVKVFTDDDGNLVTDEFRSDGEKHIIPIPQDIELQPDEEARYYARGEIREILEMLLDLTGGWEPIEVQQETTVKLDPDTNIDELI